MSDLAFNANLLNRKSMQQVQHEIHIENDSAPLQFQSPTLNSLAASEDSAAIKKLEEARFAHPTPMIRKRIVAVYLKLAFKYDNRTIAHISGLHYNMVGHWITQYRQHGYERLLTNNYGTNRSELDKHA